MAASTAGTNGHAVAVEVEGVRYPSARSAAQALGLSPNGVSVRCHSDRWPDYRWLGATPGRPAGADARGQAHRKAPRRARAVAERRRRATRPRDGPQLRPAQGRAPGRLAPLHVLRAVPLLRGRGPRPHVPGLRRRRRHADRAASRLGRLTFHQWAARRQAHESQAAVTAAASRETRPGNDGVRAQRSATHCRHPVSALARRPPRGWGCARDRRPEDYNLTGANEP